MQFETTGGKRFLSKKNVAARLNVHTATVDRLVREDRFPRPVKFSGPKGVCRWAEDVVIAWENAQLAKVGAPSNRSASAAGLVVA
jgi:predicted DNA-binding transcriptional regulator AlpA